MPGVTTLRYSSFVMQNLQIVMIVVHTRNKTGNNILMFAMKTFSVPVQFIEKPFCRSLTDIIAC
ncbi:MAG: hypothetical protein FD155_773 [Bacteroidetes bacterium]|nr:MAG: hypothetical protein FD155_773 [Bacteroidota bacterium]